MEKPPQTWRELLGNCMTDAQEGRRIARELGINEMTLTRWVKAGTNPRPQTLRRLLTVLPQHRELLIQLIDKEFTGFSTTLTDDEASQGVTTSIPSEFYRRVHHTCAALPKNLRFSSLCNLILQQALEQLDPQRLGMAIIVVGCLPPLQEHKVRSLLEIVGQGTEPWRENLQQYGMLLGAESLAGYAVSTCRLTINQNLRDQQSVAPGYRADWEESAVAAPILFLGDIAGCLLVSSTQPGYFVPERCTLVESYAELLTLAFAPKDFYNPQSIHLDIMPAYEVQRSYLSGFRQRVSEAMNQARNEQQPISYLQAEQLVWQQIAQEMSQWLSGA